jgi:hypothetical protein
MTAPERKRLLVEGSDDLYSVVELMRPSVDWPDKNRPVQIEECRGAKLLNDDTIPLRLRATDIDILGVLVDANGSCDGRWQRVCQLSQKYVSDLPSKIPASGFISSTIRGTKLGVWIMPDNQNKGMLETFLHSLVPDMTRPLLEYAKNAALQSREHGATYTAEHAPKAVLHTWLAWLDPPGRPFGHAFKENFLDARCPAASTFQAWFRELFEL